MTINAAVVSSVADKQEAANTVVLQLNHIAEDLKKENKPSISVFHILVDENDDEDEDNGVTRSISNSEAVFYYVSQSFLAYSWPVLKEWYVSGDRAVKLNNEYRISADEATMEKYTPNEMKGMWSFVLSGTNKLALKHNLRKPFLSALKKYKS